MPDDNVISLQERTRQRLDACIAEAARVADENQRKIDAAAKTAEAEFAPEAPWEAGQQDRKDKRRERFKGIDPAEGALQPPAEYWDGHRTFLRSPAGNVILPYGGYSSHKTNIVLAKVLDAVYEHDINALYVAGEDAYEVLTTRIPAQCATRGIDITDLTGKLRVVDTSPVLNSEDDVNLLIDVHREFAPKIVVIDTLSSALPGLNDSATEVASAAINHAHMIARAYKATVLLVHHTGKDASSGSRGAYAWEANVSCVWEIKYSRKARTVEIFVKKLKGGKDRFSVFWDVHIVGDYLHDGTKRKIPETMTVLPGDQEVLRKRAAKPEVHEAPGSDRDQIFRILRNNGCIENTRTPGTGMTMQRAELERRLAAFKLGLRNDIDEQDGDLPKDHERYNDFAEMTTRCHSAVTNLMTGKHLTGLYFNETVRTGDPARYKWRINLETLMAYQAAEESALIVENDPDF